MSRNGSGTYNLPVNSWNPATNGTPATPSDWQALANDIAAALTQSISKDGQTPITLPISFADISAADVTYAGTLTGGTGVINIGSGQIVKTAGGNLLIGTATDNGQRAQIFGSSLGGGRALLRLDGNDGVGFGGRTTYLSFAGTSNDTGPVQTEFGYIGAAKENGTQGNTRGYLVGAVNTGSGLVEAFRATADRNFLIGTATANDARLKVAPTATVDRYGIYLAGTYTGGAGLSGSVYGAYIQGFATNSSTTIYGIYADTPSAVGQTCYGGFFRAAGSASNNSYGSYSETTQPDTNGPGIAHGVYGKVTSVGTNSLGVTWAGYFENDSATGLVASGLGVSTVSGAATVYGMQYAHNASVVFQVLANGNLENANNSYGAISDAKLKNIIAARDGKHYWEKYKQIKFWIYSLISDPTNQQLLGVVAQELQTIFPGIVNSTPDMRTVTKTREITVTRQVTEPVQQNQTRTEIVMEDGRYVQKTIVELVTVDQPVFDEYPLYDEAGAVVMELASPEILEERDEDGNIVTQGRAAEYQPAMHKVPRMQTVTEIEEYQETEPTGEVTLSVSYSILGLIADTITQELIFRVEAQQAQIDSILTRLAALEQE